MQNKEDLINKLIEKNDLPNQLWINLLKLANLEENVKKIEFSCLDGKYLENGNYFSILDAVEVYFSKEIKTEKEFLDYLKRNNLLEKEDLAGYFHDPNRKLSKKYPKSFFHNPIHVDYFLNKNPKDFSNQNARCFFYNPEQ